MARRPAVHQVTNAARSASVDRDNRTRRYLQVMAVRIACVILAVALPLPIWARLLFIGGGVVLPWFAVVTANGGDAAQANSEILRQHVDLAQLEAPEADRSPGSARILDGQVISPGWSGGDTTPRRRSA